MSKHTKLFKSILNSASKNCYESKYCNIFKYSNEGEAVTDRYRVAWIGELTGEQTRERTKFICKEDPAMTNCDQFVDILKIIPTKFENEVKFKITRKDAIFWNNTAKYIKNHILSSNNSINVSFVPSLDTTNIHFKAGNQNQNGVELDFWLEVEATNDLVAIEQSFNSFFIAEFFDSITSELNQKNRLEVIWKFNAGKPSIMQCGEVNYLLGGLK